MAIQKRVIDGAREALMLATSDADSMFNEDARQRRIYDGLDFLQQLLDAATQFDNSWRVKKIKGGSHADR